MAGWKTTAWRSSCPCSVKTATSCLQNSSAWEMPRPRHLCLKPTSPKVEGNLPREWSSLQPHCITLSERKSHTARAAEHLRNQSLSAGDLRDVCVNETSCSTLPRHKILPPLLPPSKRHVPAHLAGAESTRGPAGITWKYSGPNGAYRLAQMWLFGEQRHHSPSPPGKIPALH